MLGLSVIILFNLIFNVNSNLAESSANCSAHWFSQKNRTEKGNTRYMTHARTSFCKVLQVQGLSLGTICRRVPGSSGRHILKSRKCLSTPPFGVDNTEIAPSLPRPCCRTTFLASTMGDGKSELLHTEEAAQSPSHMTPRRFATS